MFDWLASMWVYWVVSLGLGALGLLALLFGWFGDRWRYGVKTPRCRKCRYDMSGSVGREGEKGLTCPECGKAHKSERVLHKPRRGWKRVMLGATLLWPGLFLLTSPDVHTRMADYDEPWYVAAIPDTVRIAVWPKLDGATRALWVDQWTRLDGSVQVDGLTGVARKKDGIKLCQWQVEWLLGQLMETSREQQANSRMNAYNSIGYLADRYREYALDYLKLLNHGTADENPLVRLVCDSWIARLAR